MNNFIIILGKVFSQISRLFNLGNGSTWPGHIALKLNKNFIAEILKNSPTKTILIIGTNGKTTTSKLTQTILEKNKKTVLINSSGANLLNGIASILLMNSSLKGKILKDFAVFEIDENVFPLIAKHFEPDYLIALNLFRDQLDRYGEINTIAKKWKETISKLSKTILILNADDPEIAFLGEDLRLETAYFGLNKEKLIVGSPTHGSDSLLCPNCSNRLNFEGTFFSHLGIWDCKNCKFKHPKPNTSNLSFYPLSGNYALYDILASVLFAKQIGITDTNIIKALKQFVPAFGRQEKIIYKDKSIQIFLAKNPISFNESLKAVKELNGKNILITLNDKIPDGLDVSWIWDIDFESILEKDMNIMLSGSRKFDMALRLKYANQFVHVAENLDEGINSMIKNLEKGEVLYVLPNYSAMLEIRKILTGKEIL